jgi:hypothetical protein
MKGQRLFPILITTLFAAVLWSWAGDGGQHPDSAATDPLIKPQAAAADATGNRRGEVTFVSGKAKKQPLQSPEWQDAQKGSPINGGDKVRTLKESRAELELMQLDVIRMAPLTTIDILKLYEETKEGLDETQINVSQGKIWGHVGKVKEKAKFKISTPVAGAAITGTRFRIDVGDDSTTLLKVYQGEVRITNAPEKQDMIPENLPDKPKRQIQGPKQVPGPKQVTFKEWLYIVRQMEEIRISNTGEVIASGAFTAGDPDEQSDWVRWNLERDSAINK